MYKFLFYKKTKILIVSIFLIAMVASYSRIVFASWNGLLYSPGATLNPECLPTDTNCDVEPPITSIAGLVATDQTTPQTIGTATDRLTKLWATNLDVSSAPTFGSLTEGSIVFAGADGVISDDNVNLYWDNVNKQLKVGTPPTSFDGVNLFSLSVSNDVNSYSGMYTQNANSGVSASSDYMVGADNDGDDLQGHYGDFGIINSGWDPAENPYQTGMLSNDIYLYGSGGNLLLGTDAGVANKVIKFFVGGFTTDDQVATLSRTGFGIGTTTPGSALDVKGDIRISGSSSGYVGFAVPSAAGSTTYVLPNTDGTNNYVLTTDGNGNLSWSDKTGGTPGTVSSINGDSSALQTIAAGSGLSIVNSGATHTLSLDTSYAPTWTAKHIFSNSTNSALFTGGAVGVGTLAPVGLLSVTPLQYSTGTASQDNSTTIVGSGTTWTSAMVGSQFVFADGTSAGTITAVADATHLTSSVTQTVVSQGYKISYTGLQVASNGNIGIGTISPSEKLDVSGNVALGDDAEIYNRGAGARKPFRIYSSQDTAAIDLQRTGVVNIHISTDKVLHGDTYFNGDNATNFGIGLSSGISSKLHVLSTTEQFRLGYDASNYWKSTIGSTGGLTMQGVGTGGSLTLSPTSGQNVNISLASTGDFAVNTNQLYVDTSTSNVGIGTTSPATKFSVIGPGASTPNPATWITAGTPIASFFTEGATGNADMFMGHASDTSTSRPVFIGRKSRGTLTSPSALVNADTVFSFLASGFSGTSFINTASINTQVDGVVTSTDVPQAITFETGVSSRSERMRITSSGNIGIGTTSPAAQFQVSTSSASNVGSIIKGFASQTADLQQWQNSAGNPMVTLSSLGSLNFRSNAAGTFGYGSIGLNGTEFLFMPGTGGVNFAKDLSGNSGIFMQLNTGNVGIGTTNPQSKLDIVGNILGQDNTTNATVKTFYLGSAHYTNAEEPVSMISGLSNATQNIVYIGGGSGSYNSATDIRFLTTPTNTTATGTERMRITGEGNIGVGITSPDTKMELYIPSVDAHTNFLKLTMNSWASSQDKHKNIVWDDNSNVLGGIGMSYDGIKANMDFHSFYNGGYKTDADILMRIQGNGNVGIGTTTPAEKLDVIGSVSIGGTGSLKLKGNMAETITLRTGWNGVADTLFFDYSAGLGSTPMVLQGNGKLGLGTTTPSARFDVQDGTGTQTAGDFSVDTTNHIVYIGQLDTISENTNLVFRDRLGTVKSLWENAGSGSIGFGNFGDGYGVRIGPTISGAIGSIGTMLLVQNDTAATTNPTVIFKGSSSQTGALTQWQNSAGTVLASVSSDGTMTASNYSGLGTISSYNATNELANLYVASARGAVPTSSTSIRPITDIDTYYKNAFGGNGSTLMTTGLNLGVNVFKPISITTFSSGTHPLLANVVIKSLLGSAGGSITGSGSTITNASSLYVEGAPALTSGSTGSITNTYSAFINTGIASGVGLAIKGATSQTGALTQWQNSAGTILSSVTSDGYFQAGGTTGQNTLRLRSDKAAVIIKGSTDSTTGPFIDYDINSSATAGVTFARIGSGTLSTATSGTNVAVAISPGFTPNAAGTATYRALDINYTLTGTAGSQSGASATGLRINATENTLNGMTNNLLDLSVAGASKFRVDNSGSLSINTGASPAYPLDVNGTTAGSFAQRITRTTSITGTFASTNILVSKSTGDATDGFGGGSVYALSDDTAGDTYLASVGAVRNGADNSGALVFNTYLTGNFNERMRVSSGGNLGIGNTNPGYLLDAGSSSVSGIVARFTNSSGNCTINPTTTSLSCSSDRNLKTNITNLNSNMLDTITGLQPVTYNWNTDPSGQMQTGFIAQDVEAIFPNLVSTDSSTGLKSLNYIGLIPYSIEAIKELDLKVETLENLISQNTNSMPSMMSSFFGNVVTDVSGVIVTMKEIVADTITAKKVKTNGIEMKDTATGQIYCVTVSNGEFVKNAGECTEVEVVPEPAPEVIPESGGSGDPDPTPEVVPESGDSESGNTEETPAPEVVPESDPAPEQDSSSSASGDEVAPSGDSN